MTLKSATFIIISATKRMAPVKRREARMVAGIAAFCIIHLIEKQKKRKRR